MALATPISWPAVFLSLGLGLGAAATATRADPASAETDFAAHADRKSVV